ncbi:unnamed protein product, partial [Didymodactylos carnosus]
LRKQLRKEVEKKLLDACFDGDVQKAEECLKELGVHAKAVLNSSPGGSDTLNFLYRACRSGNEELVRLLLSYGAIAKPHIQTKYTPLYISCHIGNFEITKMILNRFPHLVCVQTLEKILPIHAACSQGHLPIVKLLLTHNQYSYALCNIYVDRYQRSYLFPFNLNALTQNDLDLFKRRSPSMTKYLNNNLDITSRRNSVDLISSQMFDEKQTEIRGHRLRSVTDSTSELCLTLNLQSTNSRSDDTLYLNIIKDDNNNNNSSSTTTLFCPFNLDIYSINGRTALHEAVLQQNLDIIHLLVSSGANVNLMCEEVFNNPTINSNIDHDNQHCFVTRSTPLSCACRLGNVKIIDYLLTSLANDKEYLAYNVCSTNERYDLIGHLLKYRSLQDNEYKLNRKTLTMAGNDLFDEKFWSDIDLSLIWVGEKDSTQRDDNNNDVKEINKFENNNDTESSKSIDGNQKTESFDRIIRRRASKRYPLFTSGLEHLRSRLSLSRVSRISTTENSLKSITDEFVFRCIPVLINWHKYGPLKTLNPLWFLQAVCFVNKSIITKPDDITVSNRHLLLHCITRIDLSENMLDSVPPYLFQLQSLKILNLSNNLLSELPNESASTTSQIWACHQLIELDLSYNSLRFLPSSVFYLKALQRLYIAHNQLQFLPADMWNALTLTDLNVSGNALKSLPMPNETRYTSSRHTLNQTRSSSEYRPLAPINLSVSPITAVNNDQQQPTLPKQISSSITTANLTLASSTLTPPRSSTSTQLSSSTSPDTLIVESSPRLSPDDELGRSPRSNLISTASPVLQSLTVDDLRPVRRLCHWQSYITVMNIEQEKDNQTMSSSSTNRYSNLTNLNLSHNRFETIPTMLCCLTPKLISLNLSHNHIIDSDCISYYPPRLKTLDLSFNKLKYDLTLKTVSNNTTVTDSSMVFRRDKSSSRFLRKTRHNSNRSTENDISNTTTGNQPLCYRPEQKDQSEAAKRRRSRSVSRHKALTSTTLAVATSPTNNLVNVDTSQLCIHRRHTQLQYLNDLNLGDNEIRELHLLSDNKLSLSRNDISLLRSSLLYPHVSRLNLSNNHLTTIPNYIYLLENLGTLILRDNKFLTEIPVSIGSMPLLWNLELRNVGIRR